MIQKILIANRGEIAVRIIRACREMGIRTVAVYSEADKEALHTQLADEAICIGAASSRDSYLNMENIISATIVSGAEAIHPGFGFLSENARFAQLCEECNITFIGPSSQVMRCMGNKTEARCTMEQAGVRVIPGWNKSIETVEECKEIARELTYPVIVKAALGGGGKGMRTAFCEKELENAYFSAKKEAGAAFVKTSTGFSSGGATAHHVALMKKSVSEAVQVKASGGIRDYKTVMEMIEAGADRIGASASVAVMKEAEEK